ncbi:MULTISPECIES: hypothetical protein [Caproicibacterium]|uniref:HTH arsR-type domain-containing protein n=1 Tax=Caproicibacterium lactatifermentans TaxID=2666138 RepID=A0A859DNZ5_9FIRM|nr:hypothetical protein [Caproicibacterium lactatifermentans]ARP50789.1 hypothetical protein B6259_07850 [Ruminococcaceae bacterium CPB6]MDD4807655.1 hypothetical protein [Oscillospiraceae bacterium]QKN23480.1 hypothetical protein GJQ69_02645 [Caproicibacterium lactatifermentans]QKO29842.1 hypothetical protein GKP14_01725 [Caproicibacterium lactatifermentans]
MLDKLIACFTHPAKSRLLLEIYTKKQATAKQLRPVLGDISQSTLYRYLNQMCQDGILKVIAKNPVRGTVEKVYALKIDLQAEGETLLKKDPAKGLLYLFTQYMAGLLQEFREYAEREDADPTQDALSFTVCPVWATREEIVTVLQKIGEILTEMQKNQPAPGRQMHSIGVIATPPKKLEEGKPQ